MTMTSFPFMIHSRNKSPGLARQDHFQLCTPWFIFVVPWWIDSICGSLGRHEDHRDPREQRQEEVSRGLSSLVSKQQEDYYYK